MHARFNWRGPRNLPAELAAFARETSAEWKELFFNTRATVLSGEDGMGEVLASEELWVVMFTEKRCIACNEAKPNFFKMASDVLGVARIGLMACDGASPGSRQACRQQSVPNGNFPHFMAREPRAAGGVQGQRLSAPARSFPLAPSPPRGRLERCYGRAESWLRTRRCRSWPTSCGPRCRTSR